ncbi:DUF4179 domain-containing protein [Sporosarcina beigongshangi]|uniref:DUF4179 domain-containing protein n=1 Tax=Sporosarcina beigongshangi TaxID=2782538 RepID=UPI00193A374C|nr:DUF4179 domain-containing protein [Sporosarcina beigongshangi]
MFKDEEDKLRKWKVEIENAGVPEDELEVAIRQGLQRAQQVAKPLKKRPVIKRGVWAAVVAAILLIAFATSIRVSPAFANVVASIPGMEKIVALIQDNKGLQSAIDNNHYQEIGVSGESSGVKVIVDGIIADKMNLVLFYTIKFKENHKSDFINHVRIKGANGEDLKWGGISQNYAVNFHDSMVSTNSLEIDFQEPLSTKNVILEFEINGGNGETEVIKLPFTIKMNDVESKRYVLNEEVNVNGQSLTIEEVTISPVRTAIQVRFDPENTMKIFRFEDLQIVNEKGKVWSSIANGTTASSDGEKPNVVIYYLQSNYFEKPKQLYLKFGKLMALEKEEAFLVIDTDRIQILQQPKDARFSNLTMLDNHISIDFRGEENFNHYPFSSDFYDANNGYFYFPSRSGGPNGELESTLVMEMPKESYKSPVKFVIAGYPSYIEKDVKIKIK